jgi:hypothetical protein
MIEIETVNKKDYFFHCGSFLFVGKKKPECSGNSGPT